MKSLTLFLLSALFLSSLFAQSPSEANLDFEQGGGAWPMNWQKWGKGYSLSIDKETKYAGSHSVKLSADAGRGEGMFGCAATSLKNSFAGSVIELRGYLKLDGVSGGKAGLFMRTDGAAGPAGIVDVNETGTEGTSDWKSYSVSLPLQGASRIWIGALNSGTGTLWADNLEVFIDGKPAVEMVKAFPADKDHTFDKGSGITRLVATPDTARNLVLLGKVWGFLKYYHPAVGEGKYNWDYELFRILPRYLKTRSKNARNAFLARWVDSLGIPPTSSIAPKPDSARTKMSPDLDWLKNTSELGKALSGKLVRIRNASRPSEHYYIAQVPGVGNPDFKNERAYEDTSYTDAGFRLLAAYRYWNMIQYFFPYRYLIKDWNTMLQVYLPRFLNARNDLEYRRAAMELIGRVEDGHANIWSDKVLDEYRGKNFPPCDVTFVEGRPVVVRTAENDSMRSDLKVGDVIEEVNGEPIRGTFLFKLRLLAVGSNHEARLYSIARLMLRTNDTTLSVAIERNGGRMTIAVRCYAGSQQALLAKTRAREMWKRLPGDIGYIFPGSIKNDSIPSIMKSLSDTKGLILDLRCYPAEFMVFTLGGHLMPRPTPFAKFSTGSITQPGLFQFTEPVSVGRENPEHYKGKVVILVNEISISQSEYTAMAYRAAPRATVIGSTTAGADGNVSPIVLPGGIRTLISGIGVYYPDGRETQQAGIVPDIVVRPTIKGIREGRDEVLERAVEAVGKE